MTTFCLYQVRNDLNDKRYVGLTTTPLELRITKKDQSALL